jgi:hypothetical protein
MNVLFRKILSISASAALFSALSLGSAFGQAAKVVAEDPSFDDLQSPQFSGGKQKSFKPKDWLEVEAKLRILMKPEPKSKTCDRFTVKWYIAVKNPEKSGTFLLLTKDVEHVNAPLGEDVYCSIYISPASLKRLGSEKGGKRAVYSVGYEVLINGKVEAEETSKLKAGWWNKASNKISRSDAVPLLNKSETPFNNSWWDRYVEVAPPRR